MDIKQIDDMIHYAITTLFDGDDGWKVVTRELVRRWHYVEGLQVCFTLVAAANAIEESFNYDSPACERSKQAYRLAALVSADLFGMAAVGGYGTKARDLEDYWRKYDPYFLKL